MNTQRYANRVVLGLGLTGILLGCETGPTQSQNKPEQENNKYVFYNWGNVFHTDNGNIKGIAIGDFDGDGSNDIAIATACDVYILKNKMILQK